MLQFYSSPALLYFSVAIVANLKLEKLKSLKTWSQSVFSTKIEWAVQLLKRSATSATSTFLHVLAFIAPYIRLFHVIPFHLAASWKASQSFSHLVCPAPDYSCSSYCHGWQTHRASGHVARSASVLLSWSPKTPLADGWTAPSPPLLITQRRLQNQKLRFSFRGYGAPSSFGRWIWQRLSILPALASSHTPGTWSYWCSRCSPCSLATRIMIWLHNMTTVRYCKYINI